MMKRIFATIVILITITNSTVPTVVAQTPTPKQANESNTEQLSNQINSLKEKIASRVAQLKLVERRGIIGTVKEVSGTQLKVVDLNNSTRTIDVDEITKFSSPSASASFGMSDLKAGTKISIVGLYNKDSERLLARFIETTTTPLRISGAISKIDKENFTLTIVTEDMKEYIADIENITKTTAFSSTGEEEKSGFSKLETGQRVVVVGYADKKEKDRLTATRILVFPSLPNNPKIVIAEDPTVDEDEVTPSTGSGKKLTPIR